MNATIDTAHKVVYVVHYQTNDLDRYWLVDRAYARRANADRRAAALLRLDSVNQVVVEATAVL